MYRIPRLIDINAKSRLIRNRDKLLIIGRCIEIEHPDILNEFINKGYAVVSVCLEMEHVNHVGFKLAGVLARNSFNEVSILTVDGSLHCTQLHWMVEEVFKIMKLDHVDRRHFVLEKGRIIEVDHKAVKKSRYLSKISKLLKNTED